MSLPDVPTVTKLGSEEDLLEIPSHIEPVEV